MKKISVLILTLAFIFSAQAQLGNLGNAVRRNVEKKVEQKAKQKADKEIDNALDKAFGLDKDKDINKTKDNKTLEETGERETKEGQIPTPEEVMASVPQLPSFQNISDYLCEQNRENPRTLKMLTNPMTKFLTQMGLAAASGYVTMMNNSGAGAIYGYDKELFEELGITEEAYEKMSETEKEELSKKYAVELQERYIRTAEMLGNDEKYQMLLEEYNEIEKEIEETYNKADENCRAIWKKTNDGKQKASEEDICRYYNDAVPIYYKAVTQAMKLRESRQLNIAKKIDEYVQMLAKERRGEVYAGFYNQAGLCATSYVGDAARLMSISDPR